MKTFKDATGKDWEVVIHVAALKRVRDLAGVDLMDVAGGDLLERLIDDPVLLVNVLYVLVKPQADARTISDEQFGAALVGGALDAAADALIRELLDFFPRGPHARALGRLARMLRTHQQTATETQAALEAMSPTETPSSEAAAAAKEDGGLSTASPASAALTPAP